MNFNFTSTLKQAGINSQNEVKTVIENTQNSILSVLKTKDNDRRHVANKYRVLVLDHRATRVLGACLRMYNITQHNIALVESLVKRRRRFPNMYVLHVFAFCCFCVLGKLTCFMLFVMHQDRYLYLQSYQ